VVTVKQIRIYLVDYYLAVQLVKSQNSQNGNKILGPLTQRKENHGQESLDNFATAGSLLTLLMQ
jgi:hypothetical protein